MLKHDVSIREGRAGPSWRNSPGRPQTDDAERWDGPEEALKTERAYRLALNQVLVALASRPATMSVGSVLAVTPGRALHPVEAGVYPASVWGRL